MLCTIDRGPVLRGGAPELVLADRRVTGLAESTMLVIEEAWEEMNAEVARALEDKAASDTETEELSSVVDVLEREKSALRVENERLETLLKKHGIDPKE